MKPTPEQNGFVKGRLWVFVAVLLGMVVLLAVWLVNRSFHHIVLTREDLQKAIERKFPIHKRDVLYELTLSDPVVYLQAGSRRIGLSLDIEVRALGSKTAKGNLGADGGVRYDPEKGELFLTDAKLVTLNVQGVKSTDADVIRAALDPILASELNRIPIYHLSDRKPQEKRAHAMVAQIRVQNGKVEIDLN